MVFYFYNYLKGCGKCEDNPEGYRNPSEHNLPYKDIQILTSDNEKLHGYFWENL